LDQHIGVGKMEANYGRNGNRNMHEDAALKNNIEAEKNPSMIDDQEDSNKGGDHDTKTVPFLKLFSFADSTDVLLMIIGTIGAIGNGLGMPIMTILFGEMINVLGSNQKNTVVRAVSKVKICSTSLNL
jgi:ATP-binding cassette subfamily B (MDR/TAP) protein 1